MGRIRTVKPDFFRHELLQELEQNNPKMKPMLVFEGLWTCCDKEGRFEWKPRNLKLDILPFVQFDMEKTLELLRQSELVTRYEVDGRQYGSIPTFKDHQRISGKEKEAPSRFPEPNRGSTGEAPEKHPGAREGKGNGVQEGNGVTRDALPPADSHTDFSDDEEANIPDDLPAAPLGNFIMQRLLIPPKYAIAMQFASAAEFIAKAENCGRGEGARRLIERARDAPTGTKWTFWLQDGGWKQRDEFRLEEA